MGFNKYSSDPRKYFKTNLIDLIELITPEVYKSEDVTLSGTEINPISQVINSHLLVADNISSVLSLSSVANSQTSSLGTINGISQYFVKQNELTKINPYLLESKILIPLGTSIANYDTSADFNTYLSATLLPMIIPSTSTQVDPIQANITTLSALTGDVNASSVHNYLVDTLGWFYFLNTSADGGLTYSPSSFVLDSLNSVYLGKDLETVDGVKGFTEYLWRNYTACSFGGYIPEDFVSGTADSIVDTSAGLVATYTSGTQRLEALKTMIDVVYSPLYIDQQDFTVRDAFDSYIDSTLSLVDRTSKGPHRKFSNILGFSLTDMQDEIENISLIYDIENVKEEHLQYIADLIGFRLRGNSSSKWRHQLRLALDLYKQSGTIAAIQAAINALIVDSVFDVSGSVQELWESYIPHLIWYSLGTESPLFHNLNTWTPALAAEAGVFSYSTSSLEENLRIVTDSILLDMYKEFPENFLFHGDKFQVPELFVVDNDGCEVERYTIVGEPGMKAFHGHLETDPGFQAYKQDAKLFDEGKAFEAATGHGPLGYGVYMAGADHPKTGERPVYLKPSGSIEFLFNYRNRNNYPMPPFEEIKYYRDCTVTADLVKFLVSRLKCFKVEDTFADSVGDYVLSSAVTDDTNIGSLNEFLMLFSSVQVAPNFNNVMLSISDYEKNLLNLWSGKSSHLFIDFDNTDFDFNKTTLEGDGKYALYEAARTAREFAPAHAITRVNLNASASDDFSMSSTKYEYLGFDHDDTRASYTSASVLGNFEYSGVPMTFDSGGGDNNTDSSGGRNGANTFKRASVDAILDPMVSSTASVASLGSVARRAMRRRNLKYLLPHEGYYDRTGFNGPVSYDPSTLENSMPSSLGELTLGYVASAGKFFPIEDHVNPSGVWHECEKLTSTRQFSGVYTSATFPYRGLSALGSNSKMSEEASATARYIDRGQVPTLYATMHKLFEAKALDYANEQINMNPSSVEEDAYWKNNRQSFANEAIASGFVLNSFEDYENFSFGTGLQETHRDYCKYFTKHVLGLNEVEKTGGNIFAQVFGTGLYNCDFALAGSAVGNMITSSTIGASAINASNVWNSTANGTFIASDAGQSVIPLSGSWVSGNINNADYRNPHILSGLEFCDLSGAPSGNQFTIFKLDPSFLVPEKDNFLINNTVIKCKSVGGLPRIRFDLSSYGDRRNYFIKDHKFKLDIKSLVADENEPILGGGKIGVWIHTQPTDGFVWSWTPKQKWEITEESRLSLPLVKDSLAHKYTFDIKTPDVSTKEYCLGNTSDSFQDINDTSLNNIKDKYFENFTVEFDTRNFTINNNFEYLDIIPMKDDFYKLREQVNRDDTNYIIEIFFLPNNNSRKYLLIDSIEFQDVTQRENAAIGAGHGVQTSGIPLRPFVKEDKLYLDKDQLRDVLKFYNGLAGLGTGVYATSLASRDATLTSGTLEVSGGSRLNYRTAPDWTAGYDKQPNFNNYKNLEFDN
jgi:hypothetical protein